MAKRDDAALKLLRWELEGHGAVVMEAMLRHPTMNLADAVDLIEQEHPQLTRGGDAEEAPMPDVAHPRATSEIDALGQEFQTFRHLLRPAEAKEMEAELRELIRTQDRQAMAALRRRLRSLSLQAAFWSELAATGRESNTMALVIFKREGGTLAQSGETAYLDQEDVAASIRREAARKGKGTYVMHLPVGRLVLMVGETMAIAALFRRAPGKDVVSVLTKTVEAIEENKTAATRTFGNEKLAGRYAEALLKLLQKTSL
ncbi:MAG: hypothetical protein A3K68_03225 [Euryarchaeota archaeon RBG_16_68_13]|nr:MAG: hypothetical protein A3K68_03225 [Euryarchaeota archaeon RBG_16_68_13]